MQTIDTAAGAPRNATENQNTQQVLAALLTLLLLIALFWPTASSILGIWSASETFTHGYFVLPVVIWLAWRCRSTFAAYPVRPDLLALIPLAGSGVVWLLSKLAGIQVGEHLAFALIIVFSLWAVLGRRIAGQLKFPLLFLFLAPVGEELVPLLMEITADMTVWAIRNTGIPIYREGLFFSLPSGNWSVVEACSGIRYLISSAVLGSLYAYLSYTSLRLRLLFIVISLIVPIIANSMRAYIIVMLGHFSGNKIATGVDHLIYGWVFFGIVMFALFSIGSLLIKYDSSPDTAANDKGEADAADLPKGVDFQSDQEKPQPSAGSFVRQIPAMLAVVAVIVAWPAWSKAIDHRNDSVTDTSQLARLLPESRLAIDTLDSTTALWQPRNQGHDARIDATYSQAAAASVRAIGFVYLQQSQGKEMVSSSNVLVRSQDEFWRMVGSAERSIALNDQPHANVKQSILTANNQRLTVWQWYRIGDAVTTSGLKAKLYEVRNKLLLQNPPSVNYLLVAQGEGEDAEAALTAALMKISHKGL